MVVRILLLPRLLFSKVFQQLRIVDLGGDHIAAAGPLTQVDGATAVAAEGKILARPEHKRAADWATQRNWFFLRHTQLDVGRKPTISPNDLLANDARHHVIVVRLSNLAAIKGARHEFLVIAKIVDK